MCLRGVSLVNEELLESSRIENLSVFVVWSSQLGADADDVTRAMPLMSSPRAVHYWDPEQRLGQAYRGFFDLSFPAWDVWMLYAPGVTWEEKSPPPPSWWEHQLSALSGRQPELRLDPERFAARARQMAKMVR